MSSLSSDNVCVVAVSSESVNGTQEASTKGILIDLYKRVPSLNVFPSAFTEKYFLSNRLLLSPKRIEEDKVCEHDIPVGVWKFLPNGQLLTSVSLCTMISTNTKNTLKEVAKQTMSGAQTSSEKWSTIVTHGSTKGDVQSKYPTEAFPVKCAMIQLGHSR